MRHQDVFYYCAPFIAEVPKSVPGELSTQISDDAIGMPKWWMTWSRNAIAFSEDALTRGMYSIHLENLSISIKTHVNFLGASLKGLIISSPQHAKVQEAGIV